MFYLEVKLNRLCLISLGKACWEVKGVKSEIKTFFTKDGNPEIKQWHSKVTKNVLTNSKVLTEKLPSKLKIELDDVIVFIGEEIFMWVEYLVKKLKLDYKFAEEIYFTPFGLIDEDQIFQKYWRLNKNKLFKTSTNYSFNEFACIFMQKDLILESKNDFINEWRKIFLTYLPKNVTDKKISELGFKINKLKTKDDKIFALLLTWINLRYNNLYYEFDLNLQEGRSYDLKTKKFELKTEEIEAQMTSICLEAGMVNPFKFFFQRCRPGFLDFIDEHTFLKIREKCKQRDVTDYERKKYFECALFVIKETPIKQKFAMVRNHHQVLLKWMLNHWPYQEFFMKMIQLVNVLPLSNKPEWKKILTLIAKKDRDDFRMELPMKRNIYLNLLKNFWEVANEFVTDDEMCHNRIVNNYLNTFNYPAVKILMNCKKEFEEKSVLGHFHEIRFKISKWIKEENFELVEKFIMEVFETENERDEFKLNLKNMLKEDYMKGGDYVALEKALACLNKLGVTTTKDEIDGFKAVELMTLSGKSIKIHEFMKGWYNGDAGKISEIKARFKLDEKSIQNCIFKTFGDFIHTGDETIEQRCEIFLKFIFDDEELKNCKTNMLLKDENSILDFALACDDNFNFREGNRSFFPIKDLTEFCTLPAGKIEELKQKCLDNLEKLFDLYTEKCKFYIVFDHLINWIVNKKNGRKQRLIKKLMNTQNATVMCNKIIHADTFLNEDIKNIIVKFYNTWLRSSKNLKSVKEEVEKLNEGKFNKVDKVRLSMMFYKLEKGLTLQFSDVLCFPKDGDDDDDEIDYDNLSFDYDEYDYSGSDDFGDYDMTDDSDESYIDPKTGEPKESYIKSRLKYKLIKHEQKFLKEMNGLESTDEDDDYYY